MASPKKTGSEPRSSAGRRTSARLSRPLAALAFVALFAMPALAHAGDVEFYAVTDKEQMGLDDTLTLTVTVSSASNPRGGGGDEDLKLPDTADFEVLSRSQSQQMSFAMGSGGPPTFKKVRVFTILLQPKRLGTLTIRPGRLVVEGKAYETGAIKVQVVPSDQAPHKPPPQAHRGGGATSPFPPGLFGGNDDDSDDGDDSGDPFQGLLGGGQAHEATDQDLYVRCVTDKKQVFLGEQVTLSIYLFSRVDISGVDGFKMPKLDAFWAEDMESPTQITGELKMIDGVPYRVFLLKKRALFPIKAGKQTIEPTEVDISTGFALVLSGRKVHRASQPITLEVNPLPAGAPPGFENTNVGQWKLTAEAAPQNTTLGQPVTLRVSLEGTGNFKNVIVPKLPPIPGFKAYDPTTTEKVNIVHNRYGGKRTLEYLLMPEQTGTFSIPSLSFPYFDPTTKKYETATTSPIDVRVEPGTGAPAAPGAGSQPSVAANTPNERAQVNVIGSSGVRPFRYKGEISRPKPPVFLRPWYLPVALSPLALWLGLACFGMVRSTLGREDHASRTKKAGSLARKRLRKAEELLKARNAEGFYAEVSRSMHEFLGAKLGAPVLGLTRDELASRLTRAGVPEASVQKVRAVLDTCDAGRFAPGASEATTMSRLHDEALAAMNEVDAAKLTLSAGGAA